LVLACPPGAFSWTLVRKNFAHLKEIAQSENFKRVAGILFDLGSSLHQLKVPCRGFSFDDDYSLDMRMDPNIPLSAYDLVNGLSQKELGKIFKDFGEERYWARIAKKIVDERRRQPIKTARQLAELISRISPVSGKKRRIHPATRSFQALRIAVNNEINNLAVALPQASEVLEKKGRLVVISFHSLEDRIVKNFFKNEEKKKKLRILTKKPVLPDKREIEKNPSSRSAKLRAAEKI